MPNCEKPKQTKFTYLLGARGIIFKDFVRKVAIYELIEKFWYLGIWAFFLLYLPWIFLAICWIKTYFEISKINPHIFQITMDHKSSKKGLGLAIQFPYENDKNGSLWLRKGVSDRSSGWRKCSVCMQCLHRYSSCEGPFTNCVSTLG